MNKAQQAPAPYPIHKIIHRTLWLGSLPVLFAVLAHRGWDFYILDVQERVDHEDFRLLGPSGPIGHGYGIFGTLLLMANLTYLLRRRFARWQAGSMRTWLDVHVFTGLFGSVLVMFHSAFQVRTSIAAITSGSLTLVVVSGLVGRYFYSISPKPNPAHLKMLLRRLGKVQPELSTVLEKTCEELPAPTPLRSPTLLRAAKSVPLWMEEAKGRRGAVEQSAARYMATVRMSAGKQRQLRRHIRQIASYASSEVRSVAGAALLRTWRDLHRLTALIMVVSVIVHIAVALYFGFLGFFSQ